MFHVEPGPRVGWTLNALLEEVLDDPKRNTEKYLNGRVGELLKMNDGELKALGDSGKERREKEEEAEVQKIMAKHGVS
jgi:hypothetical protein